MNLAMLAAKGYGVYQIVSTLLIIWWSRQYIVDTVRSLIGMWRFSRDPQAQFFDVLHNNN